MLLTGLGDKLNKAIFRYDFDKHGGATGTVTVYGDGIPAGAIILYSAAHAVAAVTSTGSATLAAANGSDGILAATGKADLEVGELVNGVQDFDVANALLLASSINSLTFTVGTAAITAGVVDVLCLFA